LGNRAGFKSDKWRSVFLQHSELRFGTGCHCAFPAALEKHARLSPEGLFQ
jgi:hypothetical protein